jgi:two-component system LytT family response regulator
MQVLVVDDEEWARRNVTVLLRRDPEVESIGGMRIRRGGHRDHQEVEAARRVSRRADARMRRLRRARDAGQRSTAVIIFVTAYDQYALRAFEAGALDYLLKPFDDARFSELCSGPRTGSKTASVCRSLRSGSS